MAASVTTPLRIEDSSRAAVVAAWGFAAAWNALAWPAAIFALRDVRDWRLAAVAVFPLAGAGLLVAAVRATLHYRRFGRSVLELGAGPGIVGRGLTADLLIPVALPPGATLTAALRRVERTTSGSGRNRRTTESIRWEERAVASGRTDGRSTRVPLAFRIPAGEPPGDAAPSGRSRVLWRLDVEADVPGVDYRVRFDVPVTSPPAGVTLDALDAGTAGALLPAVPDPAGYRQPRESRIEVSSTMRGTEIVLPAARNPGAAVGLTIMLAIWCGAIAVLVATGAPLFFPIVFGAFGLILLAGVLRLWLGVTRVEVERGRVSVTSGLLGGGRTRVIAASDVADVTVAIGMQAGSTPYYDVRIVRTNRRKVTAAPAVRDKREAEWLAHLIREALRS